VYWDDPHFRYTRYVNRLHGRSGHLWQNRFFSCPLGPSHLTRALLYVERNPVRAGMAPNAWDYPWSSACAHVGGEDASGLLDLAAWSRRRGFEDWRSRLALPDYEDFVASIRRTTLRGRPLASDSLTASSASWKRFWGVGCEPHPSVAQRRIRNKEK